MTDTSSTTIAPVSGGARIASLDVLRGIAVLGILLMNITGFALLPQAYGNPMAGGGGTGADLMAFMTTNLLFEGTMRGIFSLLFGASIVLLPQRMEQAGAGIFAADIHFRRMLWMMLFGVIHWALLLWYGEILFAYSICGVLLFALRTMAPWRQLGLALALLATATLLGWQDYRETVALEQAAVAAQTAEQAGATLAADQKQALTAWQAKEAEHHATPEFAAAARDWHQGSYWNAVTGQFGFSYEFQWVGAPFWLFFDMIPFMLIGMALLKLNALSAALPKRTYLMMLLGGYGIGLSLGSRELSLLLGSGFSTVSFAQADATYEISRLAMVVGHLGLALLFVKSGVLKWLQAALAAAGQMALSNYLVQTLICTALFFGFGFGLYEAFGRAELYYIVAAIWVVELLWSRWWLARFRFGPFEWLWRSLTYWRLQPMRVSGSAGGAPPGALPAAG